MEYKFPIDNFSNFSTEEENKLISILTKYKDIIECKKTDSDANLKKKSGINWYQNFI